MLIPIKDRNPTRTFPYVTISLIILNVFIFVFESPFADERVTVNVLYRFAFIPSLFRSQFDEAKYDRAWDKLKEDFMNRPMRGRGLFAWFQEARERKALLDDLEKIEQSRRRLEPLTLFTCLFLHGSLWHLLGNMLFLWVFGNNIEDAAGHLKFLLFYLLCGAGSSLAHMAVNTSSLIPTVGASGAISGVMGAYMILFPLVRVVTIIPIFYFLWYPIELPAFLYLGYWLLIQLVLGLPSLMMPGLGGVAWFAHIGGFFAGVLLIAVFKKRGVPTAIGEQIFGD